MLRSLVLLLLNAYRAMMRCILKCQGKTFESVAAERVVSGVAWSEFCDTLKAAGASLNAPGCPGDAFNQAEGYRYLTRLRVALENFVECSDTAAPQLPWRWRMARGLRL